MKAMRQPAKPQRMLIPSVKLGAFRQHDDPINNSPTSEYAKMRGKTMQRDLYTCQYCGFKTIPSRKADPMTLESSGFLECHHLDDNHENHEGDNLVAIDPLCHMVFHLGFAAHQERMVVIYLPWLSQEELNLMVICLGVSMYRGGKFGELAASLLQWIEEEHIQKMIAKFGPELSDPVALSSALAELGRKNSKLYAQRDRAFAGIRFLPDINKFNRQIAYWSDNLWLPDKFWERKWEKVYEQWTCSV